MEYLIIVAAILTAQYIQSLIFCITKSNKYEDALVDKIAKRVSEMGSGEKQ